MRSNLSLYYLSYVLKDKGLTFDLRQTDNEQIVTVSPSFSSTGRDVSHSSFSQVSFQQRITHTPDPYAGIPR